MDTKSQGINLSTHASSISIKDFLPVVKNVYQSVLSRDVLSNLGAERPKDGYYSDRVKFSLRNDTGNNHQNAEQQAGKAESSSVRDNLNRKANDYLKGIENRFVRRLGDQLGIPRYAQWDTVRPVIQEMSDEFLKTGRISDEVVAKAFDTAYDQGKVVDREFYDQYKDVKDYLRSTAVTLSERDRADIADFNQWRKGAFGTLRIVNEAIALENVGDVGIYYAKKEALTLPAAGVQFPIRLQQSMASDGIIHKLSEKVEVLNMNQTSALI